MSANLGYSEYMAKKAESPSFRNITPSMLEEVLTVIIRTQYPNWLLDGITVRAFTNSDPLYDVVNRSSDVRVGSLGSGFFDVEFRFGGKCLRPLLVRHRISMETLWHLGLIGSENVLNYLINEVGKKLREINASEYTGKGVYCKAQVADRDREGHYRVIDDPPATCPPKPIHTIGDYVRQRLPAGISCVQSHYDPNNQVIRIGLKPLGYKDGDPRGRIRSICIHEPRFSMASGRTRSWIQKEVDRVVRKIQRDRRQTTPIERKPDPEDVALDEILKPKPSRWSRFRRWLKGASIAARKVLRTAYRHWDHRNHHKIGLGGVVPDCPLCEAKINREGRRLTL